MLICSHCTNKGLDTIVAIRGMYRFSIRSTEDKQLVFLLEEELHIPDDLTDDTCIVAVHCARCGNDFFLPKEWISKGNKSMANKISISDTPVRPVCTDCNNEDTFIFYGYVPIDVRQRGDYLAFSKIINDKRQNITDVKAAEIIKNALVDEDHTIVIECRNCHSNAIDLVPILAEPTIDVREYDRTMYGSE